jgi:hypothetical protein
MVLPTCMLPMISLLVRLVDVGLPCCNWGPFDCILRMTLADDPTHLSACLTDASMPVVVRDSGKMWNKVSRCQSLSSD